MFSLVFCRLESEQHRIDFAFSCDIVNLFVRVECACRLGLPSRTRPSSIRRGCSASRCACHKPQPPTPNPQPPTPNPPPFQGNLDRFLSECMRSPSIVQVNPQTPNPKPQTPNPKPLSTEHRTILQHNPSHLTHMGRTPNF